MLVPHPRLLQRELVRRVRSLPHRVRLHGARNVKSTDGPGRCDPFVVAKLPGSHHQRRWTSRIIRRSVNPDWNQEHEFAGYLSDLVSQPLELKVYDHSRLSFNDPIGSVSVPLWDLMRQRLAVRRSPDSVGAPRVAQLHFADVPLEGVQTGTISFSVSFELKFVVRSVFAIERCRPPSAGSAHVTKQRRG